MAAQRGRRLAIISGRCLKRGRPATFRSNLVAELGERAEAMQPSWQPAALVEASSRSDWAAPEGWPVGSLILARREARLGETEVPVID